LALYSTCLVVGCGGERAPDSTPRKPAGPEATQPDPTSEARRALAASFERWKQARDWNPEDPSNAQKIHFTRPQTGNPYSNAVLGYTIGAPRVKEGKEAGEGTTNPDKVKRRFEFPVTYTPLDQGSRKEYAIESEWWVLELSDSKAAWVVNQVRAERKP
jgi:hypothetical protein